MFWFATWGVTHGDTWSRGTRSWQGDDTAIWVTPDMFWFATWGVTHGDTWTRGTRSWQGGDSAIWVTQTCWSCFGLPHGEWHMETPEAEGLGHDREVTRPTGTPRHCNRRHHEIANTNSNLVHFLLMTKQCLNVRQKLNFHNFPSLIHSLSRHAEQLLFSCLGSYFTL